jgi:hypothetical protein
MFIVANLGDHIYSTTFTQGRQKDGSEGAASANVITVVTGPQQAPRRAAANTPATTTVEIAQLAASRTADVLALLQGTLSQTSSSERHAGERVRAWPLPVFSKSSPW